MSHASDWKETAKGRPEFYYSDAFRAKINDNGSVDFTCSMKKSEIPDAQWIALGHWLVATLTDSEADTSPTPAPADRAEG